MSDDLNTEGFLFSLPVYVILDAALVSRASVMDAIRTYQIDEHSNCLAVFTDLDLAKRFIVEEKLADRRAWEITTQDELMDVLLSARQRRVTTVALDLSGRRGRFVSLAGFLQAVSQGEANSPES